MWILGRLPRAHRFHPRYHLRLDGLRSYSEPRTRGDDSLQVGEFYKILEGRRTAEKRSDEKWAYFLSWLVNVQLEHPIMMEEILVLLYPEVKEQMEERKRKQREEDEAILRKEFGLD
ncbi:hypothetical protein DWX75_11465 [Mitsuokella sp. AF21-1AC]|nr:hypothetical protein DWX75_11465 [Mitsuokella sp. AF21-1AC]